jgi:clan AA aspartic protease
VITGSVTTDLEAVLALWVRGPAGGKEQLAAVLDTGFDGYLTLPPAVVLRLGLARKAPTSVTLADGTQTQLDLVEATVLWDGVWRIVPALETAGGSLIGMRLMDQHRLVMEVKDGGAVVIERLP